MVGYSQEKNNGESIIDEQKMSEYRKVHPPGGGGGYSTPEVMGVLWTGD